MKSILTTVFLVAMLAGAGCGFHLRGQYDTLEALADTYYVEGDPRSQIVIGLKRSLRSSETQIVAHKDEATAIVRVFDESTGRRVLSVDSGGDVTEYEVYYAVSFQLAYPGEDAMPAQTFRLTRDYVFDREGVLGSGEEEQTLRSEMRRDLVRLIMQRLQSA
ncbi:MAG: LPS assembly lipoprotein LptE [Gammaproteobacteria bacterium]|nr:LPS assembly lipoprotein LptE [Gammaproteobacteria bacterium]